MSKQLRVFIPSHNRPDTIKSHLIAEKLGLPYTVVVHNQEQYDNYKSAGVVPINNLHLSNADLGIVNMRNYILDNLVETGEVFWSMDDNIDYFNCVNSRELIGVSKSEYISKFKDDDTKNLLPVISKMATFMCENNCNYAGFSSTDNWFFRKKRYRFYGFVLGKSFLCRKTSLRYDPRLKIIDDFYFSALHAIEFGKVLVDNYIRPFAGHFQQGGIGGRESRESKRKADVNLLLELFPNMFNVIYKDGYIDLRFKHNSYEHYVASLSQLPN